MRRTDSAFRRTAVFSPVEDVLLRPLQFRDPDYLALVGRSHRRRPAYTRHRSWKYPIEALRAMYIAPATVVSSLDEAGVWRIKLR